MHVVEMGVDRFKVRVRDATASVTKTRKLHPNSAIVGPRLSIRDSIHGALVYTSKKAVYPGYSDARSQPYSNVKLVSPMFLFLDQGVGSVSQRFTR